MKRTQILSLLLLLVLTVSIITGCQSQTPEESSSSNTSSSSLSSSSSSSEATELNDEKTISSIQPNFIKEVLNKKAINADTVGWLQIPELGIDEVIVCNKESNDYYLRKNLEKQDSFFGTLFADKRSEFGDGTLAQLGVNTCIYGSTLTDDQIRDRYDKFNNFFGFYFSPLHDLKDPEIAKTTPYMFFSTEKENLTFEIFAVFIANMDNSDLPYNRNDIEPAEFREMVNKEVLPRSIYNYDVDLKDNDKFLTLSTNIYELPDGTKTESNGYYRYVVMGRFVGPDEPLKTEATLALNPNPVIDPDGKIHSK